MDQHDEQNADHNEHQIGSYHDVRISIFWPGLGQGRGPGRKLVEAATWPSTASEVRKLVTSGAPISPGWRLPWKKMYRRIQADTQAADGAP
jgi:hypothetical protein